MTISEEDVTIVGVVVGVGGNPAVSCNTGISRRGCIQTGDVSIGNVGGGESIIIGSSFGGGRGANIDFVVGEVAGRTKKIESGSTLRVSTGSRDRKELFASIGVEGESGTDLFQVADAGDSASFFTGRVQSGEEHTSEDCDDSDHHEDYGMRNFSEA